MYNNYKKVSFRSYSIYKNQYMRWAQKWILYSLTLKSSLVLSKNRNIFNTKPGMAHKIWSFLKFQNFYT